MTVTGNFSAVIEVVDDSELTREFVLVGSDVLAVHDERWIAVAAPKIAEDLVVRAVFLNYVNHVLNRIAARGERDLV